MSTLSNLNLKFNKQKRGNNLIFLYKILKILMSKIFLLNKKNIIIDIIISNNQYSGL